MATLSFLGLEGSSDLFGKTVHGQTSVPFLRSGILVQSGLQRHEMPYLE